MGCKKLQIRDYFSFVELKENPQNGFRFVGSVPVEKTSFHHEVNEFKSLFDGFKFVLTNRSNNILHFSASSGSSANTYSSISIAVYKSKRRNYGVYIGLKIGSYLHKFLLKIADKSADKGIRGDDPEDTASIKFGYNLADKWLKSAEFNNPPKINNSYCFRSYLLMQKRNRNLKVFF